MISIFITRLIFNFFYIDVGVLICYQIVLANPSIQCHGCLTVILGINVVNVTLELCIELLVTVWVNFLELCGTRAT